MNFFSAIQKRRKSRSSLFIWLVCSYIIVLVIPLVLLGTFVYRSFVNSLIDEVEKDTLTNLSQTMNTIDVRLRELNYLALQIPANDKIKQLFMPENTNSLSPYEQRKIVTELDNYKSVNSFIRSIFIYFPRTGSMVGTEGILSFSDYFNINYSKVNSGLTEEGLRAGFNISEKEVITIETAYMEHNLSKASALCLWPIYSPDEYNLPVMGIAVDGFSMNRQFSSVLGAREGKAFILNEKGNVISSVERSDVEINGEELLSYIKEDRSMVYNKKINNCDMMISYIKSVDNNWSYIAFIPSNQILSSATRIKIWTVFIALISIMIGVTLAYFFSYGTYNPIKRITDSLTANLADKKNEKLSFSNELDMIDRMLKVIVSEDKLLQKSLQEYTPLIRAEYLAGLLKGSREEEQSIAEMDRFLGIDMAGGPYAVLIFNIDDYDAFVRSNPKLIQDLYRFAISNVAEELLDPIGSGYTVDDSGSRVVMIINFNGGIVARKESLFSIGETARRFFEEHFKFTLTVGIGGIYGSKMEICKSYLEARTAIDYKIVKGKNSVIVFERIKTGSIERNYYSLQDEGRIINCLKSGEFEGIRKVLSSVITSISENPISADMARCIYFDIINTAMKAMSELNTDDYGEVMGNGIVLPDFLKCETLKDVYEQVVKFYSLICERIRTNNESKLESFRKSIIDYMDENYCDPSLSLNSLAERFGVSQSYLSRFFKKQLHDNFVDYLHFARIKKAKELLLNGDRIVADIAEQTGYVNSHSFTRVFKKFEGIAPGKYREMHAERKGTVQEFEADI